MTKKILNPVIKEVIKKNDNKHQEYMHNLENYSMIVEWLYTKNQTFESASKWRIEFTNFLKHIFDLN